jgi:hypothetical protein
MEDMAARHPHPRPRMHTAREPRRGGRSSPPGRRRPCPRP